MKSATIVHEPKFYADIEYRDITSEGLLRASSFKGLSKK
ncbi:ATP-dependent DNA ligase [Bradyrhizobium sp. LB9.1b]